MAASHRLGHRQKQAVGEFFYVHPLRDDVCFPTRKQAESCVMVGNIPSCRGNGGARKAADGYGVLGEAANVTLPMTGTKIAA